MFSKVWSGALGANPTESVSFFKVKITKTEL